MGDSLFNDFQQTLDEPLQAPQGPFASVAIEKSLDRVLDYEIPAKLVHELRVGQRVKVPLGRSNKPTHGYVVAINPTTTFPKIKKLFTIDDPRVLLDGKLMDLARWISRYYVCPLGTVIESFIPSAVKKKIGMDYVSMVRLKMPRQQIQELLEKTKAPKRRAILARILQLKDDEFIDIVKLAAEANVKLPAIRKLSKSGVIEILQQMDLDEMANLKSEIPNEQDRQLNDDQQRVFNELSPRLNKGFSVSLLRGVTGSGKTELYLHCIRRIIEQGKQAIVLVPEIALTPQTVRRFTARFPNVAVLHSGLNSSQRHKQWQTIASGRADVVVGARSAVFAPLPHLGIIVIDEEHENSYKQDTAPRYHARDVAVKRAQMEDVPILLGSATPSLEMWHRVQSRGQGDKETRRQGEVQVPNLPVSLSPGLPVYSLFTINKRIRNLPMPHVELVDMKTDAKMHKGIHLISLRLEGMLKNVLAKGEQAILLLNRRGYSSFVYCASCQDAIHCKYCDCTMTFHRNAEAHAKSARLAEGLHTGQLHCHYCLAVNPLPATCPTCGKKLSLFGLGTQRVEEELTRKFPDLKFARVDSDTMRSSADYEKILGAFARKELHLLLGTQMIAKGLDFPSVTLVGVISGDTALSLPDFRASERTFQLITQVAGRAGRGDLPGRVILQTFQPDDPTIQAAIHHDYLTFATRELENRKSVALPPYSRMARIIIRHEDQQKLHTLSLDLATKFQHSLTKHPSVKMKGPMPCAISRIAGYFRNQIVLSSPRAAELQALLAEVRTAGDLAKSNRIAVDVDPVSLL